MPTLVRGRRRIRYELMDRRTHRLFVLVNGLTQYIELWDPTGSCWSRRAFG